MRYIPNFFYKILLILFVIFGLASCPKAGKIQTHNAPILFLDRIEGPANVQSSKVETFDFQTVELDDHSWTKGSINEEELVHLKPSLESLNNKALEINFKFESQEKSPGAESTLDPQQRIDLFNNQLSKAIQIKLEEKRLVSLLGGGFTKDRKSPKTNEISQMLSSELPPETNIIINKENPLRDGAVKLKFRFREKQSAGEKIFFGICFRMSDDLTGSGLLFYPSGNVELVIFEKGKLKFMARITPPLPPLDLESVHQLEIYFFDKTVNYSINGQSTQTTHPWLSTQKGYLGFIMNATVNVSNTVYAEADLPEENIYFGLKLNANNLERFFLANNDGSYNFSNREALFSKEPKSNFIPNFSKNNFHTIQVVNSRGKSELALDGVSVNKFQDTNISQLTLLRQSLAINPKAIIESIKVAKIDNAPDSETGEILKNINNFSRFNRIKNNIKWGDSESNVTSGYSVGEYRLHGSRTGTERGILLNSPSTMKFPVKIPQDSFLNFGIAIPQASWRSSETILFEIILKDPGGERTVIFSHEVTDSFINNRWLDFRVDLTSHSGFEGEIIFLTKLDKDIKTSKKSTFAFWGDPGIFQKPEKDEYNVILISIDTLRADRLSGYGYKKENSPNIDHAAENGAMFLNAFSQAPWTLPSHLSLFTSLYPSVFEHKEGEKKFSLTIPHSSLPGILSNHGYLTGACTGGGFVTMDYGFSQGFNSTYSTSSNIDVAYQITTDWIEAHKNDKFFYFFHTYEAHNLGNSNLEVLPVDKYDQQINVVDKYIGLIIDKIKDLGILDKTLIVITADHGVEYNDHGGTGVGVSLYKELLHVPLVFSLPGVVPTNLKINNNVRTIDIQPTILDILGIENNNPVEGKSLVTFFSGDEKQDRIIFSEKTLTDDKTKTGVLDLKSIQMDGFKYISSSFETSPEGYRKYNLKNYGELYDIKKDSRELWNLNEKRNVIAGKLKKQLSSITKKNRELKSIIGKSRVKDTTLSPETRERLKALGYLQ